MIEHISQAQANELASKELFKSRDAFVHYLCNAAIQWDREQRHTKELPEPATDKLCEYIVRQQRVEAEQAAAAAQRRSAFYDLSNDAT